jgi:hypothetical protein
VFDRVGALNVSRQNRWLVGVQFERLFMWDFLLGAVETGDSRAVVVTTQPFIVCPKFTSPKLCFQLNRTNSFLQRINIDAIIILTGFSNGIIIMLSPKTNKVGKSSIRIRNC